MDSFWDSLLHDDIRTIKPLLNEHLANIRLGKDRVTPLHYAAYANRPDLIQLLLQFGAKPSTTAKGNFTPLHIAAYHGNLEAGRALIAADTIDFRTKEEWTPLHYAALNGHADFVDLLVRSGASVSNRVKRWGWGPIHLALRGKHLNTIETLLAYGGRNALRQKVYQYEVEELYSTLHYAIILSDPELICFLIGDRRIFVPNDFNIVKSVLYYFTPIQFAIWHGNLEMVKALVEIYPEWLNLKDSCDRTPLDFALLAGANHNIVDWMREQGAIESQSSNIHPPSKISSFVRTARSSLGLPPRSELPFFRAIQEGRNELVKSLLHQEGPKALLKEDSDGRTPLELAIKKQNMELIRLFLHEARTDPVRRINEKLNIKAMQAACASGNTEICELLVDRAGLDILTPDRGIPPLEYAANALVMDWIASKIGLRAYEQAERNDLTAWYFADKMLRFVGFFHRLEHLAEEHKVA